MKLLTVGEILHAERTKQKLSLKKVSQDLRIQEKYISAVEHNTWDTFTSDTYITGVIRSYATYLSVDPEKALAFFRREYASEEHPVSLANREPLDVRPEPKKFALWGLVVGILCFSLYFGYQLKLFLTPPHVEIVSPTTTTLRGRESVKIIGTTEKDASVMIFDNEIAPDPQGTFTYDLPLKKGNNFLRVEVTGANGKKTVLEKVYVLE